MRILHLIPTLAGGGAERQISLLAGGLTALGCEVHVGIVSEGANLAHVMAAGATVHRLESRGNYDPFLPVRIGRLIRRIRPDVVQTWLTQMDVAGGLAAIATRTSWILSERTNEVYYPRDLKHGLRRFLGRFADAIVANSQGGAKYWSRLSARKNVVIPNALPLAEIEAAAPDERDFGAAEILLSAGRFDPAKNVTTLITAFCDVVRKRDAVALLCGEGPLEVDLRMSIDRCGAAERIRLMGFSDRIFNMMKRASVFVAASWFEGQPNAVMEAAACGCPLVLSDIPAHRECFGDDAALYADPADPSAFAAAICRVLNDRVASLQRAAKARSIAEGWSIDRAAAAYLRTYESVLSG